MKKQVKRQAIHLKKIKRQTVLECTQKAEMYRALYQLNAAFAEVLLQWQTLRETGLFKSKVSRLFAQFAQELQADMNQEFLNDLRKLELADWARSGKARQRWEEYLKGPTARGSKKAVR